MANFDIFATYRQPLDYAVVSSFRKQGDRAWKVPRSFLVSVWKYCSTDVAACHATHVVGISSRNEICNMPELVANWIIVNSWNSAFARNITMHKSFKMCSKRSFEEEKKHVKNGLLRTDPIMTLDFLHRISDQVNLVHIIFKKI